MWHHKTKLKLAWTTWRARIRLQQQGVATLTLSPNILIQILPTDLHTFPRGISWKSSDFVTNSYGESKDSSCEQIMNANPELLSSSSKNSKSY